ncbi:XRE family transcriptional regulator [Nocardiopsis sp. LSu2-4]|uniref:XRE family transcriptional regulator n=2 Tax=Nocardiopsis suaedae TaxID=3018444 RepID=A0ABT4TIR5_9ACTN|nr:XRE family transcriptional regulator [Nocardiopsis suaedae]MDA2804593.1 XRE family transcriptional regulator [Nocardiopsis suaedae]
MAAAQLTDTDVAAHLGVDPKTVRRWISGQRPYPRHRWAVVDLLGVAEADLWPDEEPSPTPPVSPHAQRVYPHRWEVPREVWRDLFSDAEEEIGILVYSGLFLADDAGMLKVLAERAQHGTSIRILLGDPDSPHVKRRGDDEGIGDALASRARNALFLFRPLSDLEGVKIRLHSTVLYSSLFLTEKRILANQHLPGLPAAKSPVVVIDRAASPDMADTYVRSFELVWNEAKPARH